MAIDDLLDEHEQGERVRSWLRSNALSIVGGVALGIAAIYGWQWWQGSSAREDQQAHAAYEQALKQVDAGGDDPAAALAGHEGIYADLAGLRVAKAQVEAGKLDEAIATLRGLSVEPSLKPVVDLRLAQLLTATGKHDEAIALLAQSSDGAGLEVRGDALVAAGKRDEARDAYTKALSTLDVAAPERRRVELKLEDVGGQVPEPVESI
ncbi:tetratricopeptide repeat protein [Xanthomonas sp. XNM01]|uniref:YfgM family protein n=1 Tax=Xanthomonas sp. XNM01 TaxID=2769289 RepID=UPI001783EE1E|nr:tetratricopeptide repeat protein [Xanthomonas sp. XNM01]MBD9368149.1 tetratricopeptide repeat protein [Xanthomonas sp. XNM01]